MRQFMLCSLLVLIAVNAFGHAGEVHKYMGRVTETHDDGSFLLKKTDGGTVRVDVSKTTAYVHSDGQAATPAALRSGARVVVTIAKDGKTASEIKFAATKKPMH